MTSYQHNPEGVTPHFFVDCLTQIFNSLFFENCASLHDAKPDIDDDELEERAYETTLKQFRTKALKYLYKNYDTWGEGLE